MSRDGHIFVHAFSVGRKIFCYGSGREEIRTCTSCCLRDIKVLKTVKQSSTNQNSCKCLREALTIWWLEEQYLERCMVVELISQFPAKHKGVASGPKIVFARPGLAQLLGYDHGLTNSEFIIYIACLPQSDCISLFRDPSATVWPSRIRFYVRDVILVARSVHKQSREKHRHLSL